MAWKVCRLALASQREAIMRRYITSACTYRIPHNEIGTQLLRYIRGQLTVVGAGLLEEGLQVPGHTW